MLSIIGPQEKRVYSSKIKIFQTFLRSKFLRSQTYKKYRCRTGIKKNTTNNRNNIFYYVIKCYTNRCYTNIGVMQMSPNDTRAEYSSVRMQGEDGIPGIHGEAERGRNV